MMHITGVGAYFGAQCEKNGMLVRVAGDNIMMSPPFIISPKEVDEVGSRTIIDLIRLIIRNKKSFIYANLKLILREESLVMDYLGHDWE